MTLRSWQIISIATCLLGNVALWGYLQPFAPKPAPEQPVVPRRPAGLGDIGGLLASEQGGTLPMNMEVEAYLPYRTTRLCTLPLERVKGTSDLATLMGDLGITGTPHDADESLLVMETAPVEPAVPAPAPTPEARKAGDSFFKPDTPEPDMIPLVMTGVLQTPKGLAAIIEDRDVSGVAYARCSGEAFGDFQVLDVSHDRVRIRDIPTGRRFSLYRQPRGRLIQKDWNR